MRYISILTNASAFGLLTEHAQHEARPLFALAGALFQFSTLLGMLNLSRPLAVYDLETTGVNTATDKIIEISILKIFPDGTREIKTRRLNPEQPIPRQATAVHGIKLKDVANQPTFRQIAKGLIAYLADCDLCTYNGKRFDVPMLAKEFARVQLDFPTADVHHVDVFELYKLLHPEKKPRTLSAAVAHYLERSHEQAHAAEADTIATFEVLQALVKGPLTDLLTANPALTAESLFCPAGLHAFGSSEHLTRPSSNRVRSARPSPRLFRHEQDVSKLVAQLTGICSGILADGEVNEHEALFFANWVRKNAPAVPVWPFTDILARVERIFADGVCDEEERAELKIIMEGLCGLGQEEDLETSVESELDDALSVLPYCIPQPHPLVFANKHFVVTGKFAYGTRSAVFNAIKALGGIPSDSAPGAATHYVVIGTFGSSDWVHSSQGRKIEKAVQLRESGTGLHIIAEEHWRDYLR